MQNYSKNKQRTSSHMGYGTDLQGKSGVSSGSFPYDDAFFDGMSVGGSSSEPPFGKETYYGVQRSKGSTGKPKFSWILLICSLVGGILAFLVGELLYRFLFPHMSGVMFTGIYFLVFALFLSAALFVGNRLEHMTLDVKHLLLLISGIAFLAVFGILFEFLYEAGISAQLVSSTSVIFAIDNSTVMEELDSARERVSAIEDYVQNHEELSYAVYSYDSEVDLVRSMAAASQGADFELPESFDPETGIYQVLSRIKSDLENELFTYEEDTQIVLIAAGTDSMADWTEGDLDQVLSWFLDHRILIHVIGAGPSSDNVLLQSISGKTGGSSSFPAGVGGLSDSLSSVVVLEEAYATLLSSRHVSKNFLLYGILRVLFLTLLGIMGTVMKLCLVDQSAKKNSLVLYSVLGSLLGALLLEVVLLIPIPFLGRLFMMMLFSIVITARTISGKRAVMPFPY